VDLLEAFQDVFTDVPALTTLGEHSITLTTDEPVHSKPYPIPHAMQQTVDKELENMLQMGIIEPSTSSYASPTLWSENQMDQTGSVLITESLIR